MPQVVFYPLGNADCCLIRLASGGRVLFDYANTRDPEDKTDLRCDLPTELRDDLDEADRSAYEVVAFTHLDEDHFKGAANSSGLNMPRSTKAKTGSRLMYSGCRLP